jgi:5-oxopent-3-ene-1,2,5-tricarboxylate decarboxylase/2-hydroxyhepta-2,4-diene-1,7-dioate isomerase
MALDFAPWRLSGLVLAPLLNDLAALQALGAAVDAAPYKGAPKAPVLYIKPRNTWAGAGVPMQLPPGVAALQVGGSVALLIGRTACRVAAPDALAHVAGLALVADVSVPHDSYYRPSVRFKALDGSCRIAQPVPLAGLNPDELTVQVHVDGKLAQSASTAGYRRSAARLLADVSAFMTLRPGDLLLLGVAHGAPQVRAGQAVRLAVAGLGTIDISFEDAA